MTPCRSAVAKMLSFCYNGFMILLKNVTFSYKKNNVLKDVSFSLPKGQCIGIIGANGSGKSTLLSILAGVKKRGGGEILWKEKDIRENPKEYAAMIGYVPQENPLMEDLSPYDNLFLWFHGPKKEFEKRLAEPDISMLGIQSYLKKPVAKLSGGMKKRVSIAIAFLNRPALLILDEPSAALDLPCKMDIAGALQRYKESGGTIVLTTHDEIELDLCDALYVLKDGILCPIEKTLRGSELLKHLQ